MATLLQMRLDAVKEAGAEGHLAVGATGVGDAVDNAYVDGFINSALQMLHDLLTESFQDYQVTGGSPITASVAVPELAFPAAALKLRDVEFLGPTGTTAPISLKTIPWTERNTHVTDRRYCLAGDKVLIRPTRMATGTYKIWYTPRFVTLVADADAYDAINGWELLAVLDAAIRIRDDGMEKDSSRLQARFDECAARVVAAASRRVTGQPSRVRKVKVTPMERLLMADLDPERYA